MNLDFWCHTNSCYIKCIFTNFIIQSMIEKLCIVLIKPKLIENLWSWEIPILTFMTIVFAFLRIFIIKGMENNEHYFRTFKFVCMCEWKTTLVKRCSLKGNDFCHVYTPLTFAFILVFIVSIPILRRVIVISMVTCIPSSACIFPSNATIILGSDSIIGPWHHATLEWKVCFDRERLQTNDIPECIFIIRKFCIWTNVFIYEFKLVIIHVGPHFRHINWFLIPIRFTILINTSNINWILRSFLSKSQPNTIHINFWCLSISDKLLFLDLKFVEKKIYV